MTWLDGIMIAVAIGALAGLSFILGISLRQRAKGSVKSIDLALGFFRDRRYLYTMDDVRALAIVLDDCYRLGQDANDKNETKPQFYTIPLHIAEAAKKALMDSDFAITWRIHEPNSVEAEDAINEIFLAVLPLFLKDLISRGINFDLNETRHIDRQELEEAWDALLEAHFAKAYGINLRPEVTDA